MKLVCSKNSSAIIFDLDGVLADTEPLRYFSYRSLFLQVYSIELPDTLPLEIIGQSEEINLKYFLTMFDLNGNIDKLKQKRSEILAEIIEHKLQPSHSLDFLLNQLLKQKIRLGVATNSSRDYAFLVLRLLGVKTKFSVIITGNNIKKSKPHPEIYLAAAQKLRVEPSNCIVIEDSPNGITAAKRAGMKCIAITSSFPAHKLSNADHIEKDLQSIAKLNLYNFFIKRAI